MAGDDVPPHAVRHDRVSYNMQEMLAGPLAAVLRPDAKGTLAEPPIQAVWLCERGGAA